MNFEFCILNCILLSSLVVNAQDTLRERQFSAGFYNVENLYDVVPSGFGGDEQWTPSGRFRWTVARYEAKLNALARVLNDLDADFVGLAEVENKDVVRDLAAKLREDYCYIHRTTSDHRGIDMAILYKADRFEPLNVGQIDCGTSREALHVEALWWDEPFDILVWHAPSRLNSIARRSEALAGLRAAADSLVALGRAVMILGDLNATTDDVELRSAFGDGHYSLPVDEACREGGSYYSKGEWQLLDHIILDAATAKIFDTLRGGVFVRRYMLTSRSDARGNAIEGVPKRTFEGRRYLGGASDHLPVSIFWRQ